MAVKHLLTTNLIILARQLKNVHEDLNNTFILDNGQFLTRKDRMKLQAMQRRIDKDITAVEVITKHLGILPATRPPPRRDPSSDPITNKYRS